MKNPYTILNVNQNASEKEIQDALRKQIKFYCGEKGNQKDQNGQYLINKYYNAAMLLLDPEQRKKIDREINQNRQKILNTYQKEYPNGMTKTNGLEKSQWLITSLNHILLSSKVKLTRKGLLSKPKETKDAYAVIREDNSFMFLIEGKEEQDNGITCYWLENVITKQKYIGKNITFKWEERPWKTGKIFCVDGIKSIAIMIDEFIPPEMIHDGKISIDNLKKISIIISKYLMGNPQFAMNIFKQPLDLPAPLAPIKP